MRNFVMKTYYKKVVDGIVSNLTICSTFRKSYHQQNVTIEKKVRLDDSGLQPRILKYFRDSINYNFQIIKLNTSDKWDKLNTLNNKELSEIILSLANPNIKKKLIKTYIKNIDKECCSRLPRLTNYEIFIYLHDFMYTIPHMITQLTYYNKSIQKFSFLIEHFTKIELLQLCFYVGLQKKTEESKRIIQDCLNKINTTHLNSFVLNDFVILCNSTYKTSTKIQHRKIIDKIIDTIYNNLSILHDTTFFITLIKCLRQNKAQNEELLSTISNAIFFNKTINCYNFTANSHILAFYADCLHYDDNLFNIISNQCIQELRESDKTIKVRNEYFTKQIRVKDIARFLWSLSYTNYQNLDKNVISNYIIPFLNSYINFGELDKNIEYFIDILLSMWILNYKPSAAFLNSIITKNTVSEIYGKKKKRYSARLHLLLTCVQIEDKDLIPSSFYLNNNAVQWNKNGQMRNRPYLKTLHMSLCQISAKININKFEFTSPIPHLNIIGITGYNNENNAVIYIELIDDITQVKNMEYTPHGLMSLKLRLLKNYKKPIITVFKEDVEELTKAELNKYLERKIRLLNLL